MPRPARHVTVIFDPQRTRHVSKAYARYATTEITAALHNIHNINLPPGARANITKEIHHALKVLLASILEHRTPARRARHKKKP